MLFSTKSNNEVITVLVFFFPLDNLLQPAPHPSAEKEDFHENPVSY